MTTDAVTKPDVHFEAIRRDGLVPLDLNGSGIDPEQARDAIRALGWTTTDKVVLKRGRPGNIVLIAGKRPEDYQQQILAVLTPLVPSSTAATPAKKTAGASGSTRKAATKKVTPRKSTASKAATPRKAVASKPEDATPPLVNAGVNVKSQDETGASILMEARRAIDEAYSTAAVRTTLSILFVNDPVTFTAAQALNKRYAARDMIVLFTEVIGERLDSGN